MNRDIRIHRLKQTPRWPENFFPMVGVVFGAAGAFLVRLTASRNMLLEDANRMQSTS
jgi:hypothetical protein